MEATKKKPRAAVQALSEGTVTDLLEKRYPEPAYVFMPQARNGTGYARRTTTADAVAMSTWPSRGLELLGFEIKCSRHDWLRERDDPAKAEPIQKFCDRWWLVTSYPGVVQTGELPKTWGLMVVKGGRLTAVVEAPPLKPKPIDRLFLAALLRNVSDGYVPKERVEARAAALAVEREDRARAVVLSERRNLEVAHEELKRQVKAFEDASGVQIDRWNLGRVGAAVRAVSEGFSGRTAMLDKIRRLEEAARTLADSAAEHAAKLATEFARPSHAEGPCCDRVDHYNGFGSGMALFTCPKHCSCHD